jgi:calcium/proton exchanger cax
VLLSVYAAFLLFSLWTHSDSFQGVDAAEHGKHSDPWPLEQSIAVLTGATVAIAWLSEILVGAIEPSAHELGLSNIFVGVFVVAILGNAAEHATAITAAMKDRMDLSLSIALGSSVQVALFVAPLLVLASLIVGPPSSTWQPTHNLRASASPFSMSGTFDSASLCLRSNSGSCARALTGRSSASTTGVQTAGSDEGI